MRFLFIIATLICFVTPAFSQSSMHTIEVRTRFSSFVGKPSWLLTIRDVDTGESHPYLLDIQKGENYWVFPTHGFNYLITVSNVQISSYNAVENKYNTSEIKNFCHLESKGRIIHGKSAFISIDGRLSKNSNGYRCSVQWW